MQDLNIITIFGIIAAVSLDVSGNCEYFCFTCNLRAFASRFQQSHNQALCKFFRQEPKVPVHTCQCYKNHAQSMLDLAILLVHGLKIQCWL